MRDVVALSGTISSPPPKTRQESCEIDTSQFPDVDDHFPVQPEDDIGTDWFAQELNKPTVDKLKVWVGGWVGGWVVGP